MTLRIDTTPIRLELPSVGTVLLPRSDRSLGELGGHQPHDARSLFRELVARNGERTAGTEGQALGAVSRAEAMDLSDEVIDALIGQFVEGWSKTAGMPKSGGENLAANFVHFVDRAAERARLGREEWQKTLSSLSAPSLAALDDLKALSRTAEQSIANLLNPGFPEAMSDALGGPGIAGALNPQPSFNEIDGIERGINLPALNFPTPEEMQRPTTRRLEEIAARQDRTNVAVTDLGAAMLAANNTAERAVVLAEESDKRNATSARRNFWITLLALIVASLTLLVQVWGEYRG